MARTMNSTSAVPGLRITSAFPTTRPEYRHWQQSLKGEEDSGTNCAYFGTAVFKSPVGFEAIGSPGRGYLLGPVLLTPNFSRKGPNWAFSAALSTDVALHAGHTYRFPAPR